MHFDSAGSHKLWAAVFVCGIVLENSRIEWFLWHVHVHFDSAGSHKLQTVGRGLGLRHCTSKILHNMVALTCSFAFRLRRPAQNRCRSLGLGIFARNSQIKLLLWLVAVHVDCAGSHKTVVAVLGCGIHEKLLWRSRWHLLGGPRMVLQRSLSEDFPEILVKSSWRGPCMILYRSLRSWCGPLWEALARSSCRCHVLEVLVWKLLWEALGRFLYQDLVRSAPAAAGPFRTIVWASLRGPGVEILVEVFYNSFWEALVEILVRCCQRPLQDLVGLLERSSWTSLRAGPCGKILWGSCLNSFQSSSKGPCIKILKFLCVGACMKVLRGCSYEVLVWRSCEPLYIGLYRRSYCCSCDHV